MVSYRCGFTLSVLANQGFIHAGIFSLSGQFKLSFHSSSSPITIKATFGNRLVWWTINSFLRVCMQCLK